MKNVLDNGKEIRRQIIAAGWNSVAHWARTTGVNYKTIGNEIMGKRPVSKKFLAALQKTNIKIKFRTVSDGNQVHTRVNRKDSKPAKPGIQTRKDNEGSESGHYKRSLPQAALHSGTTPKQ